MRGRAMFVTRGYMLRGEKVNGLQRNWSAGVGRVSDEPPPKKVKKGKKNKRKKIKKIAKKASVKHACSICGKKFRTPGGLDDHAKAKHQQKAVEATNPSSPPAAPIRPSAPEPVKATRAVPPPVPAGSATTKPAKKGVTCPLCGERLGKLQLSEHLWHAHIAAVSLPAK